MHEKNVQNAPWVRHISGQGDMFEVDIPASSELTWRAYYPAQRFWFDLPKSDYVICEPSEIWDDVTALLVPSKSIEGNWDLPGMRHVIGVSFGYRLKLVQTVDPVNIVQVINMPDQLPLRPYLVLEKLKMKKNNAT